MMKTYKKICTDCGNVYYNSRPQSSTCSQKCRTQLHYKRKFDNKSVQTFNNKTVETFQQSSIETFNGSYHTEHATKAQQPYKQLNGSTNSKNVLTDDILFDLDNKPVVKMRAFRVAGRTNYFIDPEFENQLVEIIMYIGELYHYLRFFENKEVDFNQFYTEMGSNWLDFMFLESETDFYDRIQCIFIYVHENIVNLIFNNSELSVEY